MFRGKKGEKKAFQNQRDGIFQWLKLFNWYLKISILYINTVALLSTLLYFPSCLIVRKTCIFVLAKFLGYSNINR
jgi:hypothetical protein